jgi:molecular chaperone GrpE
MNDADARSSSPASAESKPNAGQEQNAAEQQRKEINPSALSDDSVAALKKTRAERDDLLQRLARAQAEFENTRKRLAREQAEYKELALADAIKSLLPILDGFDWALQSPYQDVEEFRSGINLVRKQLQDSLSKLGLRPIQASGEPFDPRLHEAVEVVDTNVAQDNQVLKDVRRGYKLKDRLLRPSMVLVAHNPAAEHSPAAHTEGTSQESKSQHL